MYYPLTLYHVVVWPIETQCLSFTYQSEMSLSNQYHHLLQWEPQAQSTVIAHLDCEWINLIFFNIYTYSYRVVNNNIH